MMRWILLAGLVLGTALLLLSDFDFLPLLYLLLALVGVLWLISLPLRNASIIDIFWGIGFAVVAWYAIVVGSGTLAWNDVLLTLLVTIWALRLGGYIAWRNHGKGEDPRYAQWREEGGQWWWLISLFQVFVLQGALIWVIGATIAAAIWAPVLDGLEWLIVLGTVLWGIGFYFEAVGDWQLQQFKSNRSSKKEVLNTGLWGLTRHPNYFGDACLWWGYGCFALATGNWLFLLGPVLMTILLLKISGVALLEESMREEKPNYAEYIESTPAFFPRLWPKKPKTDA